jgi:hypothetical protein
MATHGPPSTPPFMTVIDGWAASALGGIPVVGRHLTDLVTGVIVPKLGPPRDRLLIALFGLFPQRRTAR